MESESSSLVASVERRNYGEASSFHFSTPRPYEHRGKLYVMHFFFAFVSRMWDMGIVFLVAILTNNSLYMIALVGFVSSALLFLLMSSIGRLLDKTNRLVSLRWVLAIKVFTISVTYSMCNYLSTSPDFDSRDAIETAVLYSLPILAAIVAVSFSTISQSIEKDWVVVLSDEDSVWLASTNSMMSQIDLGCASVAPAVTGSLFTLFSVPAVSMILLACNFIASFLLYFFMVNVYQSWPTLAHRNTTESSEQRVKESYKSSSIEINSGILQDRSSQLGAWAPFAKIVGIDKFLASGCAGTMIAYSFLYLTVLSFGSLMTVYLRWAGISDHWIGIFRSLNALTGFIGSMIFPSCRQLFNVHNTGYLAISYQFILVAAAALSFFVGSRQVAVFVVIYAVLFSRTGLWMFDLCTRQIAQESIPEASRGVVNGQWQALIAFFNMSTFLLALFIHRPAQFWLLTLTSAVMVGFALLTFILANSDHIDTGLIFDKIAKAVTGLPSHCCEGAADEEEGEEKGKDSKASS